MAAERGAIAPAHTWRNDSGVTFPVFWLRTYAHAVGHTMQVCVTYFRKRGLAVSRQSASLWKDPYIALLALVLTWHTFEQFSIHFLFVNWVAMTAPRHADAEALSFVGSTLRGDPVFVFEAI